MLEERGFQTNFWGVRGKQVNFCIHCDHCLKSGECIHKDDVQQLYSLLKEAEGFVIATPVYNGGVSAQIKAILDRTRALLASNPNVLRGKVGIVLAIGGDRSGGQELAIQQIMTFYTLNGILTISGGAFGANIGATFWSKDTMEGIQEDKEGLKSLKKTIKRFAEFVQERRKLQENE
jgi:multimeric flavodoxin WrbA